jgi:hypothetical protein
MKARGLLLISMLGVLGLVFGRPVWAATHSGKVVEVSSGTLTISDTAGEHPQTFTLSANAAVTRAGKICGLTDLQVGDMVTVITDPWGEKTVATKVQANRLKAQPRG